MKRQAPHLHVAAPPAGGAPSPEDSIEIDVDLTRLLGDAAGRPGQPGDAILIRDVWYRLAMPAPGRRPAVQSQAERMLSNTLLRAQWAARARRALDRRRAVRVPLLSRVRPERGGVMISTDISLSGLRASGTPHAPVMDVEFRIPGLDFPVDARVEVVSYKDAPVIPLVGMRFLHLDRPYAEHIARYVAARRERALRAAA